MVYGCITRFGFGKLVRIEGKINAEKYIAILKDRLLHTLDDHFFFPLDIIFQQDNNWKHTSHRIWTWFTKNSIELLLQPLKSPDMNIIKYAWDALDDHV